MFVYKPDCVKICHFMKHLSDVSQQGFYDLVKTSQTGKSCLKLLRLADSPLESYNPEDCNNQNFMGCDPRLKKTEQKYIRGISDVNENKTDKPTCYSIEEF